MGKIAKSLCLAIAAAGLVNLFPLFVSASGYQYPLDDDGQLIIVLDPGHGGENLGADYNGFLEKEMTMTVANAMYDELLQYDNITVYMTHTNDVDMSLQERADFAASVNADYLFCLHFNMSPSNNLFGSEVWISAFDDENREGYRFGSVQMDTMKEMGLYIRGIKTKFNTKGTDYYGILRTCREYGIPAALIEHCHVDNDTDTVFCDSEEELIAFGKADATAVAKYFGLSSQSLGVSYKEYTTLPAVESGKVYMQPDTTEPDICYIYQEDCNYESGEVTITVTAEDYDTPMLYYSYSIDDGKTWTKFFPWPGSDVMTGYSPNSFAFTVQIPSGTLPAIAVRTYNQYDLYAESNRLLEYQVFDYGDQKSIETETAASETAPETADSLTAGADTIILSSQADTQAEASEVSFLTFLKLCFLCVAILFVMVMITKIVISLKNKNK